ncbi:autotransporter outer membrane beta-barrel domain-containing protein [Pseudomonas laurylsulfatiphila]|uniref:Autotransporter outer membrane beta-barrel domain-containing protein n=1 Tax=Pseudomonas laurylsulfatiphila TaxID=2011015 RepID=A0A2S6FGU6_9PSED|nr:autotransporter outer membrane beta-barrel domain-containing protein [Pseudomonas laurylsulfatiphila]PPK36668.1 autotransporter outer membrane beta-barrel domain-containing protein [Pseudomonas laurylsulfatiphila]
MSFVHHHLALRIALITCSGLSCHVNAKETFIDSFTGAPQQLTVIDNLTVFHSGGVVVDGTAVDLRTSLNTIPSLHVFNYGQIISTAANAIETHYANVDSGYYYINNYSGGLIEGAQSAIRFSNPQNPFGESTLTNAGIIRALSGQALDFSAAIGDRARTTIVNSKGGLIIAEGGDAIRTGSHADISNGGEIISRESTQAPGTFNGIDIGAAVDVRITNNGQISGARHGIAAVQDIRLSNQGNVIGGNGAGVYSKGNAYLNNTGLIMGGDVDLKADDHSNGIRVERVAGITNSGGIQGGNAALSIGGGTVNNYGSLLPGQRFGMIRGGNNGIVVSDGNGGSAVAATQLLNYGIVRGLNGAGVKFIGDFADQVVNAGIIGGSNGIALDLGGGDDTLTLKSGGRFEGLVEGGSGRNTLVMDGSGFGDSSFGESRNFASLQVQQGTWTLTGSGDFSEGAHVYNGAGLINQGGIAGDVTVDQYASYGGGGTVSNLNINGTLNASTSIGAPRVNGNLNMGRGSILLFGINPDGTAATTRVSGNANLTGSVLKVYTTPGEYPWRSQYTVLEAGSITGTFGHVTGENYYAFVDPKVSYLPTRVDITYTRNDVDLSEYARTANGARAVDSIQSIGGQRDFWGEWQTQNPLYDALLSTSRASASAAIESLAGSSFANLGSAALNSSAQVGTSMLSAMQQTGSGSGLLVGLESSQSPMLAATGVPATVRNLNDPRAQGRVWLQGLGGYGKLDGEHGEPGLEQRTAGSVLGVDWSLSPEWRMGVLGGYSKTDLDSHNFEGTLHSWHVGAYAMRQDGPLALRLGAAYSGHDGDTKRTVEFEDFSDRPKGNYDADSQQAFGELGYLLGSGRLNVEPFANLGYQRYHREGFTEKGGLAALAVDTQTQDNFSSTFGVRLAQLNQLQNGISVTPRGSLGWRHTYGDVENETRQAFVLGGSGFNVQGSALDRDSLMVGAGLDVGISARHTLSIGYNAEVGSNSRNQALTGQWQMSF